MTEWLLLCGVMLLGAMIPGANMAIVMRNTLAGGARYGFITVLGLASALLVHGVLSMLGLITLINQMPALADAIRWLGGAYLLYMGATFLLTRQHSAEQTDSRHYGGHPWLNGLMVSLLNPKVILMFMALFSQVLEAQQQWTMKLLYTISPAMIEMLWLSLFIWLLSRPALQQGLLRIRHRLEKVVGGVLVLLGIKLGLG
ncbi:MAG: LysE family transporter [Marinobacterium sp.]|nr:LysE family transporter [Marinobacterium sp.]